MELKRNVHSEILHHVAHLKSVNVLDSDMRDGIFAAECLTELLDVVTVFLYVRSWGLQVHRAGDSFQVWLGDGASRRHFNVSVAGTLDKVRGKGSLSCSTAFMVSFV